MKRSIKIDDQVYQALMEIGQKRETFSETIQRIILAYRSMQDMADKINPLPEYQEWKRKKEAANEVPKA
jgi:predicted CopG family antitoxin